MAPFHVVEKVVAALSEHKQKALNGARILMLGIAYKKNVEDTRESPAFVLIHELETRGASVDYFDPFVPAIPHTREHSEMAGRKSVEFDSDFIGTYDAVLICTDHDGVDYAAIARSCDLVIDTRNVMRGHSPERLVRA